MDNFGFINESIDLYTGIIFSALYMLPAGIITDTISYLVS